MMQFLTMLLDTAPFADFRHGFANVIKAILGLVAMVSLAVTVIHVIKGDRESANKMLRWLIVTVVGYILIEVIAHL